MQNTITIGRTEYQITKLDETTNTHAAYALKGPRSSYHLWRNTKNPKMMFPVGPKLSMPKWWVREQADGTLREVRIG